MFMDFLKMRLKDPGKSEVNLFRYTSLDRAETLFFPTNLSKFSPQQPHHQHHRTEPSTSKMERYIVNIYDKKPQPGESKKAIIVPFSPDSKVQEFIAEVKRRSIENRSMKNWECISMFLSAYDGPFMYSGDTMRNVVLDSTKEEIWAYVAKNCPCARLVKCGGEHADEPSVSHTLVSNRIYAKILGCRS